MDGEVKIKQGRLPTNQPTSFTLLALLITNPSLVALLVSYSYCQERIAQVITYIFLSSLGYRLASYLKEIITAFVNASI